jgi:hypothetical protein
MIYHIEKSNTLHGISDLNCRFDSSGVLAFARSIIASSAHSTKSIFVNTSRIYEFDEIDLHWVCVTEGVIIVQILGCFVPVIV